MYVHDPPVLSQKSERGVPDLVGYNKMLPLKQTDPSDPAIGVHMYVCVWGYKFRVGYHEA